MEEIDLLHEYQKKPGSRPGKRALDEPAVYEFKVVQHVSNQWADWFDSLEIVHDEQGYTLLRGTLVDQSALHGVLIKIRDLNLTLLSVMRK